MGFTKNLRLAIALGFVASALMSFAFFVSMSPIGQKPGILASFSKVVAKPGFLGIVAGMFVSGNAHSGGSLLVVTTVASIVNFGLYTTIAYGIIRLLRTVPD